MGGVITLGKLFVAAEGKLIVVVFVFVVVEFAGVDSDVREERPAALRPLEAGDSAVPWGRGRDDRDERDRVVEVPRAGAGFAACRDPRFVREKGDPEGAACPAGSEESEESDDSDIEGSWVAAFELRLTEAGLFVVVPAKLERFFSPSDCAGVV